MPRAVNLTRESLMPFGKMKGQPLVRVFQDLEYMAWMATRVRNPSGIMSEVIKLFREYIKEEELFWNKIPYEVFTEVFEDDEQKEFWLSYAKKEWILLPGARFGRFHLFESKVCKKCMSKVSDGDRYCTSCGNSSKTVDWEKNVKFQEVSTTMPFGNLDNMIWTYIARNPRVVSLPV